MNLVALCLSEVSWTKLIVASNNLLVWVGTGLVGTGLVGLLHQKETSLHKRVEENQRFGGF